MTVTSHKKKATKTQDKEKEVTTAMAKQDLWGFACWAEFRRFKEGKRNDWTWQETRGTVGFTVEKVISAFRVSKMPKGAMDFLWGEYLLGFRREQLKISPSGTEGTREP